MEIQPNVAAGSSGLPAERRGPQWADVPQALPEPGVTIAALSVPDRLIRPGRLTPRPAVPPGQRPQAKAEPPKRAAAPAKPASKAKPSPLVLTSDFGVRTHPVSGGTKFHKGIDLAAPMGARIRASRGGKVTFSGEAEGYGRLVIVDHGQGVETRYAHASALLVNVGDTVKAGQTIARVGTVGQSTGPHLHFEVRRQGRPVDPWPLLAGGKSRAWYSPL